MHSSKHVARNFLALGSGEAISRLIAFGAVIYIARVLGADGYGVIAFAVGVNLYLSKIADFAIEWVGAKEIARHRQSFEHLASAIMGTRLALAVVITAVSILAAQWLLPQPERDIVSLYFLTMLPIAANTKWVHMGLEDARPIGLSRVLGESIGLAIVLLLLTGTAELWVPPVAQISSEAVVAILLFMVLKQRGYRLRLSLDLKTALPVFKAALPVLVHLLLGLLIYNSDLIFLRMFRDSAQVGYYAAAYTLISFLSNLGLTYGMSLLPTLTRLGAGTAEEKSLYHTALAQVYAVCIPISVGGCLLAAPIIDLAFGDPYSRSALVLAVLIWSIPMSTFRNVPWAALIARGRQDLLMKAIMYAAAANIAMNLVLIPPYGMLGAAAATIATECLVGFLMLKYAAGQALPFVTLKRLWKPSAAAIVMALAMLTVGVSSLPVGFTAGVVAYLLALAVLGGITLNENRTPSLNV